MQTRFRERATITFGSSRKTARWRGHPRSGSNTGRTEFRPNEVRRRCKTGVPQSAFRARPHGGGGDSSRGCQCELKDWFDRPVVTGARSRDKLDRSGPCKSAGRSHMVRKNLLSLVALSVSASLACAQDVSVLVAYHSQTGNTETMAGAIAEGARNEGADVALKRIGDVTKEDLEAADGVALGAPVHMGDVSVEMRRALVDWAYGMGFWRSRGLVNKACAVFTTGGAPSNGKEFTMLSMALGMLQYGMVLVTPYGGLGASATTGIPEHEKGVGEHETEEARKLGARLVEVARLLKE